MSVTQVSVFVENRYGRLKEVTEILSGAGINIIAHALLDTTEFGVLRMIVDSPEKAVELLKFRGFAVRVNEVTAVLVDDRPGGFDRLLALLASHEINFSYTYSIGHTAPGQAVNIMHFENSEQAGAVLKEKGATLLTLDDLVRFWQIRSQ